MKAARDSSSSSDDNNNSTNKSSGGGGAPAQSSILGTVEKATGKITGCEGMVKEGEARMPRAGIEESNGTGWGRRSIMVMMMIIQGCTSIWEMCVSVVRSIGFHELKGSCLNTRYICCVVEFYSWYFLRCWRILLFLCSLEFSREDMMLLRTIALISLHLLCTMIYI